VSGDVTLAARCAACGKAVDVCECCEEPNCKHVICDDCLKVAVGERRPRTYTTAE
jgi:hypothetical protein